MGRVFGRFQSSRLPTWVQLDKLNVGFSMAAGLDSCLLFLVIFFLMLFFLLLRFLLCPLLFYTHVRAMCYYLFHLRNGANMPLLAGAANHLWCAHLFPGSLWQTDATSQQHLGHDTRLAMGSLPLQIWLPFHVIHTCALCQHRGHSSKTSNNNPLQSIEGVLGRITPPHQGPDIDEYNHKCYSTQLKQADYANDASNSSLMGLSGALVPERMTEDVVKNL